MREKTLAIPKCTHFYSDSTAIFQGTLEIVRPTVIEGGGYMGKYLDMYNERWDPEEPWVRGLYRKRFIILKRRTVDG